MSAVPSSSHHPSTPATRFRLLSAPNLVMFLLGLMYLLTYIDRVNVSTASNVFEKELHLDKTQVGLVFSAFAYPYLIFQIVGGYLGDRFGPRRVLTICSLIWAGATILTGLVGGLYTMLAARVLLGIGEGATFPTATSAMSNWTRPADRGFAQGFTHAFARIGNSLTPPLIVLLMAWIGTLGYSGWRGSFVVMGLISLLWVLLWFYYFRDDPAQHSGIRPEELAQLPPYVDKATRLRNPVPWGPLFRRMLPVIFVYFCYGWILWLFLSWIPQYFKNQQHLDLKQSALFSMGVFFAGVVGDTLGGIVSDHRLRKTGDRVKSRSHLVSIFFLCALACIAPLLLTSNLNVIALALAGAFFFAEMTIGPMWSIPMDIAPKFSGSASGFMNSGSALAAILSPTVAGLLIDKTGNWNLPFYLTMALLLIGAIAAFWMHPDEAFTIAPESHPASREPIAGKV
ncbi:MAG: MFS transporter [Verrucomicrobia bacterium]|nr:MFS transporter [Verrucomicrobiota bacterium]